ncbi:MAG: hypothetical protein ACOYT4_02520 [Nanoarchaeota archaeon]
MIGWIILGIFIFLALIIFRLEHFNKKIKLSFIIIIGLLIYISAYQVFSAHRNELDSPKGILNAFYAYVGYLGNTATNLWDIRRDVGGLVGNAIRLKNETGFRKS